MTDFSANPFAQALQLLMAGEGYNFYNTTNLARADDLLVRARASASLSAAAGHIAGLAPEFRRLYVPPSSRDQPFPPADVMARLKDLQALAERLRGLESQVRGMPVPTQDKIWWRFRNERPLLESLIRHDYNLVHQAAEIETQARTLTASSWAQTTASPILDPVLAAFEQVIRARAAALMIPVG